MNKNKIIAFRVDEEKFNKYSSLNIKERKKFVNKCNELLEKFLLKVNNPNVNNPNVNNSKVNNPNVNNSKVNNPNVNNPNVNNSKVNNLYSDSFNQKDEVKPLQRLVKKKEEEFNVEEFLASMEEEENE